MTAGPLDGIRVLDLADASGTYCGKLLADMGADVIKIEPRGGDPMREIGPFYEGRRDRNRSLFFWHYNANKRSVVLDLDDGSGREQFDALAGRADVLIATGTPDEVKDRALDYGTLALRHPHLIVAIISPFGQSGPYAEWRSCDTVAQALGGMAFLNGHAHEPPLRSLGLQAYHSAALHAAIGVILALLVRERTGAGQLVDVSLQESVAAAVEHVSATFHQSGEIEVRRGTLHWSRTFRVGRCRDGHVLLSHLGDWTSLLEWMKADGAAGDLTSPAWEDFQHRRTEWQHLFQVLDKWAERCAVADLVDGAQLRRLPYAPVAPLASLPAHPQLQARGFFVPLVHDEVGRAVLYPGAPYRFSATPWQLRRRAPMAGEHNAEILRRELKEESEKRKEESGKRIEESAKRKAKSGKQETAPAPAPGSRVTGHESRVASHESRVTSHDLRVLRGVRVLDFTWEVAGPVATRVLADHGADVIRVERRDMPDDAGRRGGLTGNLNRGKRSVAINMADARGVALARDLVRCCDVVIDNFSRRVMPNWGLDCTSLCQLKPDIIAVNMSGFGNSGPHADYVSYGPTLQAQAGYTWHMRHCGGEPAGWGFSYSDTASGYSAALAVSLALWHRARTGLGQCIDLSQFEAVAAMIGPALLDVLNDGTATAIWGNESPERPAAPHGIYRCSDLPGEGAARDRWCAIAVFSEEEWVRFVGALGNPAWTGESHFSTLEKRLTCRSDLDAAVESWTSQRSAETVMRTLQGAGVCAGVVANAEDLCLRDQHLRARGYWAEVRGSGNERFTFDGVPARLSATPGFVSAPGPLLGEHTDEVLRELLAMDQSAIDRLRAEGVV